MPGFEKKQAEKLKEGYVEIPELGRAYFWPKNFPEKDKGPWKKNLIRRAKRAEELAKKFASEKTETLKEITERAFAKLLDETGYFDRAKPAEWVNDSLDKCDVVLKLENGGWLAIQHSVRTSNQELLTKRGGILKKGKITLPEHLDLGEMPIVFVKDEYKNYVHRFKEVGFKFDIPWIEYYRKKLKLKPEAKLWKYFDNINEMITDWVNQIEESLTEEIKLHPEDKSFFQDYLEKIQKVKKMHQELTASLEP